MFGKFLRYMMDKHNFNIEKLATIIKSTGYKTSKSTIGHCINGYKDCQNPRLYTIKAYAQAFGLTMSKFFREFEKWEKDY